MKNIKIFSKDWLALHPYVQSTPVDSYYTNIANRIYDILVATELINSFEGDEAKQISIRMLLTLKMLSHKPIFGELSSADSKNVMDAICLSLRRATITTKMKPTWKMFVFCCGTLLNNIMDGEKEHSLIRIIQPIRQQPT